MKGRSQELAVLPFLGTQELGKDGESSRDTLDPRSATSLSPDTCSKAREGLLPDFSLAPTLPRAPFSLISPSMPSGFRATLERGCAPLETP